MSMAPSTIAIGLTRRSVPANQKASNLVKRKLLEDWPIPETSSKPEQVETLLTKPFIQLVYQLQPYCISPCKLIVPLCPVFFLIMLYSNSFAFGLRWPRSWTSEKSSKSAVSRSKQLARLGRNRWMGIYTQMVVARWSKVRESTPPKKNPFNLGFGNSR